MYTYIQYVQLLIKWFNIDCLIKLRVNDQYDSVGNGYSGVHDDHDDRDHGDHGVRDDRDNSVGSDVHGEGSDDHGVLMVRVTECESIWV